MRHGNLPSMLTAFVRSLSTVLVVGVIPVTLAAQPRSDDEGRANYVSRNALEQLERRMRLASESPGYSDFLRADARIQAEAVRRRLERGDFEVGDRIFLSVELEVALSDTFTVNGDREVTLPEIGDVAMHGVLRAELQEMFETYLAQYIRNPVVQTRSLIPITVLGGASGGGFYTFPSEMRLTELLNLVGTPTTAAEFNKIRIVRNGETVIAGRRLQELITAGATLDQLNVSAGDQIVLPLQRATNTFTFVRTLTLLLTIPFTIVAILNLIG